MKFLKNTSFVAAVAVAAAWTFTFGDFLVRLVLVPAELNTPWILPFGLGLSTLAFAAVFALLWLSLGLALVWKGAERVAVATAIGAFLLVAGLSYARGLLTVGAISEFWLRYLQFAVMHVLAGVAAYAVAVKAGSSARLREWAISAGLATPFLILELVIADLVKRSFDFEVYSAGALLLGLPLVAAGAATVWVFHRPAKRRSQAGWYAAVGGGVAALLLLAYPIGATRPRPGPTGAPVGLKVPRVILLTVDTLRRDALSLYGGKVETKNIARLAADGVLFTDSHTSAPWTLPSFSTIMTGVSPFVHRAVDTNDVLPAQYPTLAEILGDAGYFTKSVGFNLFLSRNGLQRGFADSEFYPRMNRPYTFGMDLAGRADLKLVGSYVSTTQITDMAVDWVEQYADSEFFLWTHYFDPHGPYEPPREYWPEGDPDPEVGYTFFDATEDRYEGAYQRPDQQLEWIQKLYEAEIRYVDDEIGRFLDALQKEGIYDDALIVFTSDHGEEIGEHYGVDHGHTLYQELLGVPLIVKFPRSTRRGPVDRPVSNEDVFATVLETVGVPYDREEVTSRPLFGESPQGAQDRRREALFSTGLRLGEDREAVIFDGVKLIRHFVTNRQYLYDLRKDPGERDDLRMVLPDVVAKGNALLEENRKRSNSVREHFLHVEPGEIDSGGRIRKILESLGYAK